MLPEKVIWTEGMLLKPQHFQQQDSYTDSQSVQRSLMLCRHAWGFTEFLVNKQYLSLGKVVLSKGRGILPDGTLFEIGHGVDGLSLDIEPGTTGCTVVLALPISQTDSSMARDEANMGLSTRFIAHAVEVRDSNAGQIKETAILCARQDLKVMFMTDSSLAGHVYIPILRIIECTPEKEIIVDKDFMPTFLHLDAAPALSGYLREIIGLVSHRGDQLALRISKAGNTGTAEIADFMLLQCINRMEPIFRHLDNIAQVHPEVFYLYMLSLVGELSSFVESGKRPKDLPAYNHADQHLVFYKIMEQARFALSMVLEQHAVELPMQPRKYGVTVSPIHDRSLLATASFILVVRADMDQEALRTTLPKQLKISSVERIRDLVNLHLPGVKVSPLPVAPRQIPFHAGKSYFRLDLTSEELAQLELSGGFAFYISGSFPGLQLQFWAIKE
jgi:type VI secretion system protein ImpJ